MDDELESKDGSMWTIHDLKSLLQEVYDHYRSVVKTNDYLKNEIEKVKSEKYADEVLLKMRSEYEKMKSDYYRGFPISEEESKKIKEWMNKQIEKNPSTGGAIGGRFSYKFIPTGVGTIGIVIDGITDETFTFSEI